MVALSQTEPMAVAESSHDPQLALKERRKREEDGDRVRGKGRLGLVWAF